MKTINVANTVLFAHNGDLDVVRRLKEACEVRLRICRVDPATVDPLHGVNDGKAVNYKEATIIDWVNSVVRVRRSAESAEQIAQLKTIYAACKSRDC